MPTRGVGKPYVRPVIPPGGDFRTARETAAINDSHREDRLPVHRTFVVDAQTGDGWSELVEEMVRYNAVEEAEAEMWLQRMLVEPAYAGNVREYSATVLGVKAKLVGVE